MEEDLAGKSSLLAEYFGLHPLDAYEYSLNIQRQLQNFIEAFKERIEVEINYSKSLFKISKQLVKYIHPENPSPLSYICSAFKVENEQRARHALQLAQYLHTEIEVVCQSLLQMQEAESRKLQKELKQYYKQGEMIEESYQKNLKRYFNSKQSWEDKMISKSILFYTPGVAQSHKEKMTVKLQEEKREVDTCYGKYLDSLQVFNRFAERYNEQIQKIMVSLEEGMKKEVMVESDCLRKLIVSEISMFKNIEYDMLNISKQMECLNLQSQIELFVNENKRNFVNPILSVYKEGPISENSYRKIDYKYPINRTLMQETLVRIQNRHFDWILYNKKNSTLQYALQRIWKSMQGAQKEEDTEYMREFEDIVKNNVVVRDLNVNNEELRQQRLRPQQAYSISLQILHNIGYLCRKSQQSLGKEEEKIELLRSYFSIHHFYRFIALLFLEEYQNQCENRIQDVQIANRFVQIILAVLNESFNSRDIFVIRGVITIIFTCYWEEDAQNVYLFEHSDILENEMWENIDLWEAVVFQASYESISLLPSIQRIQLREVYLMRQKNIIFEGLMAYTRYMIMLGLQSKEVKRILGRYCQIYNLYEEHEHDLIKAIHESENQYRQNSTSK